jgi:hypothetical protein
MTTRQLLPWAVVSSLLLHGVAYASLHAPPPASKAAPRKTQVSFDVVSRPVPNAIEPRPKLERPSRRRPSRSRPSQTARSRSQARRARVRSISPAAAGGGERRRYLVERGPRTPSACRSAMAARSADVQSARPGPDERARADPRCAISAPAEPPLVAVGDLSTRRLRPRSDRARAQLSADAAARAERDRQSPARIDPDGVVRRVALLEESERASDGVQRTLTGSRWAPKDKAGRPVATEIRYTPAASWSSHENLLRLAWKARRGGAAAARVSIGSGAERGRGHGARARDRRARSGRSADRLD